MIHCNELLPFEKRWLVMRYLYAIIVLTFIPLPALAQDRNQQYPQGVTRSSDSNTTERIARRYLDRQRDRVYVYNGDDGVVILNGRRNYGGYNNNSGASELTAVCGQATDRKYERCVREYTKERQKIRNKYSD